MTLPVASHVHAEPAVMPGVGLAIAAPVQLRTACASDVAAIHSLIEEHLHEGHLLPRTREEIVQGVNRFVVAVRDGLVVGCAELARLASDVAEIRSLVVSDEIQGRGIGRALVETLIASATHGPYRRLCAFTHAPAFFVRLGFSIAPHLDVPEKVFTDCVGCPLFRRCGQHAVVFWLDELPGRADTPRRG